MAGGRIRHWKHGWIPISPEAKAYVAGRGPRPVADSRAPHRADVARKTHVTRAPTPDGGHIVTVDDVTEVAKTRSRSPGPIKGHAVFLRTGVQMSEDQKTEVAQTVNEVMDTFPSLKKWGPIPLEKDYFEGAWAVTDNYSDAHKITLSPDLWDDPDRVLDFNQDGWTYHQGIIPISTARIADREKQLEAFRRATIIHELGHYIHMRNQEQAGIESGTLEQVGGELDNIAIEPVTPRELGFTVSDNEESLDSFTPRWTADRLGKRSNYAGTNQYEWLAEAFIDGFVNREKADPSSRRVFNTINHLYGDGKTPDLPEDERQAEIGRKRRALMENLGKLYQDAQKKIVTTTAPDKMRDARIEASVYEIGIGLSLPSIKSRIKLIQSDIDDWKQKTNPTISGFSQQHIDAQVHELRVKLDAWKKLLRVMEAGR